MKKIILLMTLSLFLTSCAFAPGKNNNPSDSTSKTEQKNDNGVKEDKKTEITVEDIAKTGIVEGRMAPDFVLKDIDGREVELSNYRGKTVMLNFFGVWCIWCTREMPGFMNVYKEYKDKNVELLVVDVGDSKDTVIDYLKSNNFDIKPVMDAENKVSTQYRVSGFPTTLILDDKGIIVRRHEGFMDENMLRSILDSMKE